MSRLYDRVLDEGCVPVSVGDVFDALYTPDEQRQQLADSLRATDGREATDDEVDDLLQSARLGGFSAVSPDVLGRNEVDEAVVILCRGSSPLLGHLAAWDRRA